MRLFKVSILLLSMVMPLTTPAQNKIFPYKYFTDDLPNGLAGHHYSNRLSEHRRALHSRQHRLAQRSRTGQVRLRSPVRAPDVSWH